MKNLWNIYHENFPEFIEEFAGTKTMQRLDNIGMNCGCEYSGFEIYNHSKKYSRYVHSIGVALIIWHFTKDIKQSISGLFHDIATPVFAHTIDFFNGDHEKQESTENYTRDIIEKSNEITDLLKKYNIRIDEVSDYHIYPIADNESPKLSADRLEYSLGNMWNYGFCSFKDVCNFYSNLTVSENEFGELELCFLDKSIAVDFTNNVLKNSFLYISDKDRALMQKLADLIKTAYDKEIISIADLYTTEESVINLLTKDKELKILWEKYRSFSKVYTSDYLKNDNYFKVNAKKRYIDPYIKNIGRVSEISDKIKYEIDRLKKIEFDNWLYLE